MSKNKKDESIKREWAETQNTGDKTMEEQQNRARGRVCRKDRVEKTIIVLRVSCSTD